MMTQQQLILALISSFERPVDPLELGEAMSAYPNTIKNDAEKVIFTLLNTGRIKLNEHWKFERNDLCNS